MIITTDWLKEHNACSEGMDWFSMQSETDGRAVMESLISAGKIEWANWLITRMLDRKCRIRYAVFAAEQVLDIFEKQYHDNKRPKIAIESARLVLKNDTPETRAAAKDAGESAEAAGAAAWAAGNADWTAGESDWTAAWAAGNAAWSARNAAWTAGNAAWAARESTEASEESDCTVGESAWAAGESAEAAGAAAWTAGNADEVSMKIKIIKHGISLLEGKYHG